MAEVEFDLKYDGPALDNHEMDVRDLAPALLSTGDLFQNLNKLAHPLDPAVVVNVRANAPGSFVVALKLVGEKAIGLFANPETTAVVNLNELVHMVGDIFKVRKRRAQAEVVGQEEVSSAAVRLSWSDGTTLEVLPGAWKADQDLRIQRSLSDVVRPLYRDGVESLTLRQDHIEIGRVDKEEVEAFRPLDVPPGEILSDAVNEEYLRIVNLAFQPGNKWRLSDGQSTFYATILDTTFLQEVDAGKAFSKRDLLHCRIRRVQWRDDLRNIHRDVTVEQVIEHLPDNEVQDKLPFESTPRAVSEGRRQIPKEGSGRALPGGE